MNQFYLTFGHAHPLRNGWVLVIADTYMDARVKVMNKFGIQWSSLYSKDEFERDKLEEFFPEGQKGILK